MKTREEYLIAPSRRRRGAKYLLPVVVLAFGMTHSAMASTAYGSLNNFDCVNDTGTETHGFEIELDDCHSTDITYTYDYNHYGKPKIREDNSDPLHPKTFVRYESLKNPDGTWKSYTAIPSGPISPTQGHQFTNPAVNFGGEHFGVGFRTNPSAVMYNWLVDNGTGNLVHGPAVYISTPSFAYIPPAPAQPAQVVAAVVPPPPPPELPKLEFGEASWVKDIKTTSHNPKKIPLKDLVGDDPGKPQPWANGEVPEVETEWRVLQTEFAKGKKGKNGELRGKPENMPGGDEMITRRYEFYKYVGPVDAETGEAMGDTVGPDGIHGQGIVTYAHHIDPLTGEWVTVTKNMANFVVVGDFFGSQMAGFDVAPKLGLIDNIQDCDVNTAFPRRTVVIKGGTAFLASITAGKLPTGLVLNSTTGILAGTPKVAGVYNFTVQAADTAGTVVSQAYTVTIVGPAPVNYTIATSSVPVNGGTTRGFGTFLSGTYKTVTATAKFGYRFIDWTEGGGEVSILPSYRFQLNGDRNLVANFVKQITITTASSSALGGSTSGDGTFDYGTSVTVDATANAGYAFTKWTSGLATVSTLPSYTFTASVNKNLVANFAKLYTITPNVGTAGGTVSGGGTLKEGSTATVKARPKLNYHFVNWTEGGLEVSNLATYAFPVSADRTLSANFAHD